MRNSLLLAALLSSSLAPVAFAANNIQKVALTSDPLWTNAAGTFDFVGFATLDNLGNAYFAAGSNGGSVYGNYALSASNTQYTIFEDGVTFNTDPIAASNGTLVLADTNTQQIRKWSIPNPSTSIVAQVGDIAPDLGSNTYTSLTLSPAINPSGSIAFIGNYSAGSTPPAIWNGTSPTLLAKGPDLSVNSQPVVSLGNERINASGTTVFTATNNTFDAIYQNTTAVIQSGDSLDGATVQTLFSPSLNNAGNLAFKATTDDSLSRIVATDGTPFTVLQTGSLYASVGTFNSFDNPLINSSNQIAVNSILTDPLDSNAAIVLTSDTSAPGPITLSAIAREGDFLTSLGLPTTQFHSQGDVFDSPFSQISVNDLGQILFLAYLDDETERDDITGIFLWDHTDGLSLIAKVGDTLPAAGGLEIAALSLFGTSNTDDGLTASLNDSSQILFKADFTTSDSGLFLASSSEIPEPTTLSLLSLATLTLLRRPSRKPAN